MSAEMKKRGLSAGVIALIVVVVLLAILAAAAGAVISTYNSLVSMETAVDAAWAEVENAMQRRMDLIPNLVATAKGYMTHEEKVFTEIADARSRMLSANTPAEMMEANQFMDRALAQLLAVSEAYPDLKANTHFTALMDELSASENKLFQERRRYNDAVAAWNVKIKQFPTVIVASMFGKTERPFFEARPGADEPPVVSFD